MKYILKLLATALALVLLTQANAQNITNSNTSTISPLQPKIVGGYDATRGAWPYIVALAYKPSYDTYGLFQAQFCAGTLIDKNWVMTAAHCVVDFTPDQVLVAVGPFSLINDDAVEHIMAKRFIVNPSYDGNHIENGHDIALIELSQPSNVTPAKLFTDTSLDISNLTATAIGWGSVVMQDENQSSQQLFPDLLQQVALPIVSLDVCSAQQGYGFNNTTLCAGYSTHGKGTCQGDSGGPLFIQLNGVYYQAGIVSAGVGCAYGYYGLFSNVATLAPFVEQYVDISPPTVAKINKDYSGLWYNRSRSGEGWTIEMLSGNRILAYWFTYDKNNKPLYVFGSGDYDPASDSVTIAAYTTKGPKFGAAYDKNALVANNWGSMTFKFKDCGNATISYDGTPAGYGTGSHDVVRLTTLNSTDCFNANDGSDKTPSGSWYLPARNGEGFLIEALPSNKLDVYWYTYDLAGNPIYIYGVGDLVNGKATIDMNTTNGTSFGDAFNTNNVQSSHWGTITVEPKGCYATDVTYNSVVPGYGSGSFVSLNRIAYIDGGGCN